MKRCGITIATAAVLHEVDLVKKALKDAIMTRDISEKQVNLHLSNLAELEETLEFLDAGSKDK